MFDKLKNFFSKSGTTDKSSVVNADTQNDDDQCQVDRKFEAIYYNLPLGMITISFDKRIIQNYNSIFATFLENFYYPHGVGKAFSELIFKNSQDAFEQWISNVDETSINEGIEIKLIRDKMGSIDIPILVKINKLLISKQENIIVLSVINIDTYLNQDLRFEEEKYLLEKNNCAKNKIFIDTFSELKVTLTKFVNHEEQKIETDRLKHVLTMVERVLDYYEHNPNACPYCAADHESEHEIAERIRRKFENVKVLVVDDMDVNLDIVSDMLRNFVPTSTVDKAKNGQEALELINKNKYDIILIDLVMPIMDGYETIERLRDEQSGYEAMELPIVVLTALSHKSDKDRALAIGVNDYLTKPVHPRELIRVLEKWV